MPDDSAFCPNCGTAVNNQNKQQQFYSDNNNYYPQQNNQNFQPNLQPEKPNKNSRPVLIGVIAVVAVVILVGAGVFIGNNSKDDDSSRTTYNSGYDDDNNDDNGERNGKAVDLDSKYLVDDSNLFTDEEKADLIYKLEMVSDAYDMDVVIHTTDSFYGQTAGTYAWEYYVENGYGRGSTDDGFIYVLNLDDGEWYICTFGKAIDIITHDRIDIIGSEVNPLINNGEYYDGMLCYIEKTSKYLYDEY